LRALASLGQRQRTPIYHALITLHTGITSADGLVGAGRRRHLGRVAGPEERNPRLGIRLPLWRFLAWHRRVRVEFDKGPVGEAH